MKGRVTTWREGGNDSKEGYTTWWEGYSTWWEGSPHGGKDVMIPRKGTLPEGKRHHDGKVLSMSSPDQGKVCLRSQKVCICA